MSEIIHGYSPELAKPTSESGAVHRLNDTLNHEQQPGLLKRFISTVRHFPGGSTGSSEPIKGLFVAGDHPWKHPRNGR